MLILVLLYIGYNFKHIIGVRDNIKNIYILRSLPIRKSLKTAGLL